MTQIEKNFNDIFSISLPSIDKLIEADRDMQQMLVAERSMIATNISQASQGLQEVNENVNQSSAVATSIARDIAGVDNTFREIADSSRKVKSSAGSLQNLATELKGIVDQFKV